MPTSRHFSSLRRRSHAIGLLAFGTLLGAFAAHADVTYTTEMKIGTPSDNSDNADPSKRPAPTVRTTTQVKDMRERVETSIAAGPITIDSVTITQCDTHKQYKVDADLKIYTVGPIGVMKFAPPSMPMRPGRGNSMEMGKPGEGKIISTFTAQDLGKEKITDLTTQHSMLNIHEQSSGCIGDSDKTLKMETWVAPVKVLFCPDRVTPTGVVPNENGCQITYEQHGDMAALKDMFTGMMVRMKFYDGDKVVASQDLREYSEAALDDALFTIPDDYKEVTEKEFAEQRQKAMMRKFMPAGMGGMFGH